MNPSHTPPPKPVHPSTLKSSSDQGGKDSSKRKKILTLMTIVFLSIAILYLFYWLIWSRFQEYTEDAYVGGNIVELMPQVSGTIIGINTDDNHLVLAGQTLIKLDEADAFVALQHARANLAQTVRQVRQYYEDVRQGQATVLQRKADFIKAQLDLQRRKNLVEERAISREELHHVSTSVENAEAQYNIALYKLASAIALVENATLYQHPLVEQAKANFMTAYLNWMRITIKSPVAGYVAKRNAQVGQHVMPGTALLAVIPLNEIWVDANYKESQLKRIRIGQEVLLHADVYGDEVTYHGKVAGISAGTGSAFQLLPPQNATGNWIKIVQRVPVRIQLNADEIKKNPLRIGLSMRVTVYTRGLKGNVLTPIANNKPIYQTTIFNSQLANVSQEMNTIIHANAPYNVYIKGLLMPKGSRDGIH